MNTCLSLFDRDLGPPVFTCTCCWCRQIRELRKNLASEKSSRSDLEMYVAVLSAQIDKLRQDLHDGQSTRAQTVATFDFCPCTCKVGFSLRSVTIAGCVLQRAASCSLFWLCSAACLLVSYSIRRAAACLVVSRSVFSCVLQFV